MGFSVTAAAGAMAARPALVKTTPAIAGATCAADACALTRALTSGPADHAAVDRSGLSKLTPAAPPVGWSAVQGRQVDPAQPLGVGEDIDLDDPPVSNREAHDRKRSSPCGEDDARGAVHQRRSRHA